MIRPNRFLTVLAAVALTSVGTAGLAAPAVADTPAATRCVIGVSLPGKVAIHGATTSVRARLLDPTHCSTSSDWAFHHDGGYAGGGPQFERPATSAKVVLDTSISGWTPGAYSAFGTDAGTDRIYVDSAGNQLFLGVRQEESAVMTLKYASRLRWTSGIRHGAHVTLTAVAKRWKPTYVWMPPHVEGTYVAWQRPRVDVQKKVEGEWRTVKTVRADKRGVVSVRVAGARQPWRLVTEDSAQVWGAKTSAKVR